MKGLGKYCDLNLVNLINGRADKHTVEVRVLPGMLEVDEVVAAAALFEGILGGCRDVQPGDVTPDTLVELLIQSPMDEVARTVWLDRIRQANTAIAGSGRPYSRG